MSPSVAAVVAVRYKLASVYLLTTAITALMLLVGWQEGHPVCKKTEWWGADVVVCLERDAELHAAQLMPMPLTVSCFRKIQIGFTSLVPAHPGSPGQKAVKRVCVCACVLLTDKFRGLNCSQDNWQERTQHPGHR